MICNATISEDGKYRYLLTRRWSSRPLMVWCMLNPSTADASIDDPTIRRCISFSVREGYGGIHVVNLMAFRATDPTDALCTVDPRGPQNDDHLRKAAAHSGGVIAVAWGGHAPPYFMQDALLCFRQGGDPKLKCLGIVKDGNPRHPLYVADAQPFEDWRMPV